MSRLTVGVSPTTKLRGNEYYRENKTLNSGTTVFETSSEPSRYTVVYFDQGPIVKVGAIVSRTYLSDLAIGCSASIRYKTSSIAAASAKAHGAYLKSICETVRTDVPGHP